MLTRIVDRNKCNACEACAVTCPVNAIKFKVDDNGFFFPEINELMCIKCGKCGKVCPVQKQEPIRNIEYNDTESYAAYIDDLNILKVSSSGGIFTALAKEAIDQGMIVCGVVYSNDFKEVKYTTSIESSIDQMRGSKYVTARKYDIYSRVKELLTFGQKVFFFGLPCEIAGLYSFLGDKDDNLITCELICAGPSSYSLLYAQQDYLKQKYRGEITDFTFRDKIYGWVPYAISVKFSNNKCYKKIFDDTIFGVGMKHIKRTACYDCYFKDVFRVADITIGDFWKIDKTSDYYNENGTSVVFARTKKGKEIIENSSDIVWYKVESCKAIDGNLRQLKFKDTVPITREEYLAVLKTGNIKDIANKFVNHRSIIQRIKYSLPVPVFNFLRRVSSKRRKG